MIFLYKFLPKRLLKISWLWCMDFEENTSAFLFGTSCTRSGIVRSEYVRTTSTLLPARFVYFSGSPWPRSCCIDGVVVEIWTWAWLKDGVAALLKIIMRGEVGGASLGAHWMRARGKSQWQAWVKEKRPEHQNTIRPSPRLRTGYPNELRVCMNRIKSDLDGSWIQIMRRSIFCPTYPPGRGDLVKTIFYAIKLLRYAILILFLCFLGTMWLE